MGDIQLKFLVVVTPQAEKIIGKAPKYVQILFREWVHLINRMGIVHMQKIPGYRYHSLKGKLTGLRSSSLTRSYRVIYRLEPGATAYVIVIEVNKHDYKI